MKSLVFTVDLRVLISNCVAADLGNLIKGGGDFRGLSKVWWNGGDFFLSVVNSSCLCCGDGFVISESDLSFGIAGIIFTGLSF